LNIKQELFIIAEIGQAHEGSLGMIHSYIDALSDTGINAIKFQMHLPEAESSVYEPFRIKFSYEDETRFDYWKRMSFTFGQWQNIKKHCEEVGVEFLCTPFSNLAVDWLEKLEVKQYKIGSGEVNNFLILEKIAKTQKPIILSSGMSSFEELDETTRFLKQRNVKFSILQCTTSYPTMPENFGLNVIQELKNRYNVEVGFSDHSAKIETCIAATALGATIIEFHVVFDRKQFGPDSKSSLNIEETKELVKSVRNIRIALNNPINKANNENYKDLKEIFEKSLAVNKDLPQGHIITFNDLEAKKPKNHGIDASKFELVIGKKLIFEKKQWDFLKETDLA
jgi:N-acetylneuraminate synthase